MHASNFSWRDFYLQATKSPPADKTGKALKYELKKCTNGKKEPASFQDFIENALYESGFCDMLTDALINVGMTGYVWECPSVSESTKALTPFEFVVIPAIALTRRTPNPHDFIAHMATRNSVVSFLNLSGDAELVVPTPPLLHEYTHMGHLGSFLRHAPRATSRLLWRVVADTLQKRLQRASRATRVWLSTSGLSVPWLHIRLDSKPKYYQYAPYRETNKGALCSNREVLTNNCNIASLSEQSSRHESQRQYASVGRGRIKNTVPDTHRYYDASSKSTSRELSPSGELSSNHHVRRHASAGRRKRFSLEQPEENSTPATRLHLSNLRELPLRLRGDAIIDAVARYKEATMTREEKSRTDFRRKKSML